MIRPTPPRVFGTTPAFCFCFPGEEALLIGCGLLLYSRRSRRDADVPILCAYSSLGGPLSSRHQRRCYHLPLVLRPRLGWPLVKLFLQRVNGCIGGRGFSFGVSDRCGTF